VVVGLIIFKYISIYYKRHEINHHDSTMTSSQLHRSVVASSDTLCIKQSSTMWGFSPWATSDINKAFILMDSGKNSKVLRSPTLTK
jgi:hypothetical protein